MYFLLSTIIHVQVSIENKMKRFNLLNSFGYDASVKHEEGIVK